MCGVSSGRTPRSYGTGLAHPSPPGFQSWKTAPTGSFVLFPSRMPVILVLAHRIHVLRGAAVGQEFDGLQPCKAGRAPCYRIPRQMTLPTLPSSWGQSYDADRRARERHVVSTGRVDNSREVIVDAQLYRLSRASSEWRHSQQPCFDVLLVDTGIPVIRIWFLNFAGPRFTRFTYYNLFSILLCISLVNWSKIESLKTEFAETFLICRYEFSSDWDTIINN